MPGQLLPTSVTIAIDQLPSSFEVIDSEGAIVGKSSWEQLAAEQHRASVELRLPATTDLGHAVTLCIPSPERSPLDILALHEAQHRARNLVSLIVSIARQSLSTIESEPSVEAFVDRLRSLDAVARIGCEVEGDLCKVDSILTQVTQRLDDPIAPRIARSGPAVAIAARWAHLIAIVAHELTVNALRHGSLSVPSGRVDVRWSVVHDDGADDRLVLRWRERAGPPVPKHVRVGFGTRMLRDLVGANRRCCATMKLEPTGLVYELVLTLSEEELRG